MRGLGCLLDERNLLFLELATLLRWRPRSVSTALKLLHLNLLALVLGLTRALLLRLRDYVRGNLDHRAVLDQLVEASVHLLECRHLVHEEGLLLGHVLLHLVEENALGLLALFSDGLERLAEGLHRAGLDHLDLELLALGDEQAAEGRVSAKTYSTRRRLSSQRRSWFA